MYGQERLDDFVFKYRDLMYESKDQDLELDICPLCNEANEHYTVNGICDCEVQEIWSNDETTLSLDDYTTLFFKML